MCELIIGSMRQVMIIYQNNNIIHCMVRNFETNTIFGYFIYDNLYNTTTNIYIYILCILDINKIL